MKFEKVISPNIPGSDVENTVNWEDLIDRTDIPVKSEPPPLDAVPSHVSVDLTTDTDDEISKPQNIEPERVENELEKSDEICDTTSTASVLGKNDAENTDTDVPEEVNDLKNKRLKLFNNFLFFF